MSLRNITLLVVLALLIACDPAQAPRRIPAITVEAPDDVTFSVRRRFVSRERIAGLCPLQPNGAPSDGCAMPQADGSCLILVRKPNGLADVGMYAVVGEEYEHCAGMRHE